jgi:RNA polymerase sigma factor (sigma-70 family)
VTATETGDADACRKLVEAFLPAVAGLARSFHSGSGVERRELVQEGVAGLLFAAQRYDPRLNTPFWAYASLWVRKAMQELVAELARPVALSERAIRSLAQIRTARSELLQAHGIEPTNEEWSSATGFYVEAAREPTGDRAHAAWPGGAFERGRRDDRYGRRHDHRSRCRTGSTSECSTRSRSLRCVTWPLSSTSARSTPGRLRISCRSAETLNQIGGALGLTAERARQIGVGAPNKLREALSLSVCAGDEPTCTRTSTGLLELSRSRSAMRARIGFIDVDQAEPSGRNRSQPASRGSSTWILAPA